MIRKAIFSSAALLFAVGGCGKTAPCEDLAKRLCEASAEHCDAARPWLAEQGAGDAAARDATCTAVLADAPALAGYMTRFATAMAPTPTAPAAVVPTVAAPGTAAPATKPTTKEQVREVGATIEEVGNATEKAGEAIDKLRDAVKTDEK